MSGFSNYLIALSDIDWQSRISEMLLNKGFSVLEASELAGVKHVLNTYPVRMAFVDPLISDSIGINMFRWISKNYPATRLIGLTSNPRLELAVIAYAGGAHDFYYLQDDEEYEHILHVLGKKYHR